MSKKAAAKIKNLNAPKKSTWTIAFFAAIAGAILSIAAMCGAGGWAACAGSALLLIASALLLLAAYVKGL